MRKVKILILIAAIDVFAVVTLFALSIDPSDCIVYTAERTNYSITIETTTTCWYYDPITLWIEGEPFLLDYWSEVGIIEICQFYDNPEISCRPWICDPENSECSTNPFSN
ncbi:MAG: hypothetical protein RBS37_11545 [Bacteroidales bacterium]|jgi:hypothetical protein|nr:hypothetical protein [Bacteroidales bacterium]